MKDRVMEWRGALRAEPGPVDADQEALQAFLAGDQRAFDHLFERYHGYVYNICLGITGCSEDAHDMTQETFIRVHRSLGSFRGASRFTTWLYRIAVNCSVEHTRRRGREFAASDLLDSDRRPGDGEGVEEAVMRLTEGEQVRQALARIHVPYRTVLTLRYLQGLTMEEIARVLECRVGVIKVRLHRARKALRDEFIALESNYEQDMPANR